MILENWRDALPESCAHLLKTGSICSECIKQAIRTTERKSVELILSEVKRFDCTVLAEGENNTEEQRRINAYADGTVRGYKDAVKQICEFLEDMLK